MRNKTTEVPLYVGHSTLLTGITKYEVLIVLSFCFFIFVEYCLQIFLQVLKYSERLNTSQWCETYKLRNNLDIIPYLLQSNIMRRTDSFPSSQWSRFKQEKRTFLFAILFDHPQPNRKELSRHTPSLRVLVTTQSTVKYTRVDRRFLVNTVNIN